MTVAEMFQKHKDEYLKFDRIPIADRDYLSKELCALTYINGLMKDPSKFDYYAEHGILYLPPVFELKALTEEDVIYLRRCGIHYDEESECLADFC